MAIQPAHIQTALIGPTELFIGLGRDPQHDEHMRGYRFHLYVRDSARRMDAVWAETRKIIADLRESDQSEAA